MRRTSISAGLVIYEALKDFGVTDHVTRIFPGVMDDEVKLPFICYRRTATQITNVTRGAGSERATIEILCAAASYEEVIDLAELAREAIENKIITSTSSETEGLTINCGGLVDSDDFVEGEAHFVSLIFNIGIYGRSN